MARAHIKTVFDCDLKRVWDTVTTPAHYEWRSDLIKTEVMSDTQFVEISHEEYPTYFTVTACEPLKQWELDIDNGNLCGHWIGKFTEEDGKAIVEFSEEIAAKRLMAKPFIKLFIQKHQEQFVEDLRKALIS